MKELNKDIFIGFMFITGIWSFISGLFIFSTLSFGGAAVISNLAKTRLTN